MSAKRPPYRTALAVWGGCGEPILCKDLTAAIRRPLGTVKAALSWLAQYGYLERVYLAGRRVKWVRRAPLPPASGMPEDQTRTGEPWDFSALLEVMPLSRITADRVRRLRELERTRLPTVVHHMPQAPKVEALRRIA
jgi:hypothetical protein